MSDPSTPGIGMRLLQGLTGAAIHLLIRLLAALPWRWRRTLAHAIGSQIATRHRNRRQAALANLELAFGAELDDPARERIARQSFEHFVACLLDALALTPGMNRDHWRQIVQVPEADIARLNAIRERGHGVLIMFSHYGAWELMAVTMPFITSMPIHGVARRQAAWIEPVVEGLRTATGNHIIHKEGAVRATIKALKNNELVGLSIDQNFSNGIFVPFFGVRAGTVDTLAALARTSGAPIVPVICTPHAADGAYTGRLLPAIEPTRSDDKAADVERITRACLEVLETTIRERPELWLWSHKRWKSRPPDEVPKRQFYLPKHSRRQERSP